ncbi:MAG: D-alanine--D-alanine ligase [Candidatus Omnitrophota bacterium]|nr:D-alanine--D-alanine ligase [Candidatus Omnitrophota bacterium]
MKTRLRKRIGVLMGGSSSEREVSLQSGLAVYRALRKDGCRVTAVDINSERSAASQIKKAGIELAFIALHGRFGEDGGMQALLESLAIPYTGSGIRASRLAIDKTASRKIFQEQDIAVPRYRVLEGTLGYRRLSGMKFPLVIKPSSHGSSIGLSIVRNKKELVRGLNKAGKYSDIVIAEEYISGKEVAVGILNGQALPLIWLIPKNRFYDYQAKYRQGMTLHVVPAPLDEDVYLKIQSVALRAHRALNCQAFSRVDIILDKDNNPVVLEVNTIPGFTSTSLLPLAARVEGYSFENLCRRLIELIPRYEKRKKSK